MSRFIPRALSAIVVVLAMDCTGPEETVAAVPNDVESSLNWHVLISEPATGLLFVRGEVPPNLITDLSSLTLRFRDMRRHPDSLRMIRAWSNEKSLQVEFDSKTEPDIRTIDLAGASGSVVIEYTINPTFYPPGNSVQRPADARSRVTDRLGVVRTWSVFPALNVNADSARIGFTLPDDWVAVTPWKPDASGFLVSPSDLGAVEYLGLGPFDVREVSLGATVFRISALSHETGVNAEQIASVVRFHADMVGAPPPGRGPRTVVVVPLGFMRGGAAGSRSIVQGPSPVTLAHEAFHWWTHSELARPEARWFTEGFTNYYGIKAARGANLVSEEDAAHCLSDLSGEMRHLERVGAQSLADASRAYGRDSRAHRLVYSKGTLLAFHMDRQLESVDRSLDEVMKIILSQPRRGMTNEALGQIFSEVYGDLAKASLDAYVDHPGTLPDFGFDPPTGTSGCARYLPGR